MNVSFLRTILLYITIVIALRIMGKRQIGELSPSEFVITILTSELATVPMQSTGTPLLYGIMPILTLLSLEILISTVSLKSRRIRKLVAGRTSILVENGKINQSEMTRLRLTLDELLEELRLKGFLDIAKVKYAILEANGELSVFPFTKDEPATKEDMNLPISPVHLPKTVISDGVIIESELKTANRDERWIREELSKRNIERFSDVFLMQINEDGKINLIPKEKKK